MISLKKHAPFLAACFHGNRSSSQPQSYQSACKFPRLSVENIVFLTSCCRLMQETYSASAWTACMFSFYFIFALSFLIESKCYILDCDLFHSLYHLPLLPHPSAPAIYQHITSLFWKCGRDIGILQGPRANSSKVPKEQEEREVTRIQDRGAVTPAVWRGITGRELENK